MKIEDVAKLTSPQRFIYWIKERHAIYTRRRIGKPKPWTDDEVMQDFFFTSPYRESDKTTVWFRENIRGPLKDDPNVLMATVIFRWFNLIATGRELIKHNLLQNWNYDLALVVLGHIRTMGGKVFTGAYMINSPGGEGKLEAICRRIENVWKDRHDLIRSWHEEVTMEDMHRVLTEYEGLGGFMAYEVVTDLRHTFYLRDATDILTWCNPGPGCIRGLYRVADEEFEKGNNASSPPKPKDWQERMVKLLALLRRKLPMMPAFEMRTVETSLCEFDKYCRLLWKDGRSKRRYDGRG